MPKQGEDPEVKRMIEEVRRLPDCAAANALWEQVACAAETRGDLETAWRARCAILGSSASHNAPRFETLFMNLAWCLAVSDKEPDRFAPSGILWQYKWVVTQAPEYASIPRSVLVGLVADMDQRFIRAGWGRRAGLHKRVELHDMLGEPDIALGAIEAWRAVPRDRGSDCMACEASTMAELLQKCGQDEQAVREARRIVAGQLSCATVPHCTFGALLPSLLRLGRLDLARTLYDKGRRLVASMQEGGVTLSAPYLLYAALIGDHASAVAILRARLIPALSLQADGDRMRWFGRASIALELLAAHGVDELDLPTLPPALGSEPRPVPLASVCASIAEKHAASLDQRNGNASMMGSLARSRAQWLSFPRMAS